MKKLHVCAKRFIRTRLNVLALATDYGCHYKNIICFILHHHSNIFWIFFEVFQGSQLFFTLQAGPVAVAAAMVAAANLEKRTLFKIWEGSDLFSAHVQDGKSFYFQPFCSKLRYIRKTEARLGTYPQKNIFVAYVLWDVWTFFHKNT